MEAQQQQGDSVAVVLETLRARALRLESQGRFGAAALEYQAITDLAPHDTFASRKLAQFLASSGQKTKAADEYLRLAGLYARVGRAQQAVVMAKRALVLSPERAVRYRLTPLVFRLGRQADAICEMAAAHHFNRGHNDEAREILRLMVDGEPTSPTKRMRLAGAELRSGHVREALRHLNAVAAIHRRTGHRNALARVQELLLIHGDPDMMLLRELADYYLDKDDPAKALTKLKALRELVTPDTAMMEKHAMAAAMAGELEEAMKVLDQLVSRLCRRQRQTRAKEILRRAREWNDDVDYQVRVEVLLEQGQRRPTPPGPLAAAIAGAKAAQAEAEAAKARPKRARSLVPPPPPVGRTTSRPIRVGLGGGGLAVAVK